MMTYLTKYPEEESTYSMDFEDLLEDGESLTGDKDVKVSRVRGRGKLTSGAASASGSQVQVVLSGGSIGSVYQLVFTSETTLGHTIAAGGFLKIDRT